MKNLQPENGYFGNFGGAFIPEILHEVIHELTTCFEKLQNDADFQKKFAEELSTFSCRPTPLMFAKNLTEHFGTAKIYIKREDLNHTGAHKLNNVIGQGLLAKKLGKTRVIAETGAGQHGVATATMAARMGLECVIYMGAKDVERQRPNVFWMEKLGAKVVPVSSGGGILKDAINEAMKDWTTHAQNTHYVLGTACGPHPFPAMVAYFQRVIGDETRLQILQHEGQLPDSVYACVGGGSNAIGMFQGFLEDEAVELVAVEAGGKGIGSGIRCQTSDITEEQRQHNKGTSNLQAVPHAARLASDDGSVGIAQGYKTYFLQNADGQLQDTHSIAAGLDYVGVSPIFADLFEKKSVRFTAATDEEVLASHALTIKKEGIIPALESAHAFAQCFAEMDRYTADDIVIINQSGRGDKDIFTIADAYDDQDWKDFIIEKAAHYSSKNPTS